MALGTVQLAGLPSQFLTNGDAPAGWGNSSANYLVALTNFSASANAESGIGAASPSVSVPISGQTTPWIETQKTVAFLRPVRDILLRTPGPTAGLAQPLSLRQVRFAALQLLSRLLLLGHIHRGPKKPFENLVVEDWNANATNIANLPVWSNDPLLYVSTGTLLANPLHGLCHGVAVLRMNGGQKLLERRRSLLRVEALDLKQFPRPIFKKSRGIESPAPRMTETLPFGEIELASLQLL